MDNPPKEKMYSWITCYYFNNFWNLFTLWKTKSKLLKNVKSEQFQNCFIHLSEDHIGCSEECQRQLLEETILHERFPLFPPSIKYQQQFLKTLIDLVELSGMTCIDEIYTQYISLLNAPIQLSAFKSYYLVRQPELDEFIVLKESNNTLSSGTTGLVTWVGGLFLSEWCLSNKELFRGRDVVELGSGCGMTGIAVRKAIPVKSYVFTDCHADVLEQLSINLQLNKLDSDGICQVRTLDWQSDVINTSADVLLAADVVFDPSIVPSLVTIIHDFLHLRSGCRAFIVCTVRNQTTFQTFISQLETRNLIWIQLDPKETKQTFFYDRSCDIRLLRVELHGRS